MFKKFKMEKLYSKVFNKSRKMGVTKTIKDNLPYEIGKNGWDLSEEVKDGILTVILKKFRKAIEEGELDDEELELLKRYLKERIDVILKEEKYNRPSREQERFYMTLLEVAGEIGSYQSNKIDINVQTGKIIGSLTPPLDKKYSVYNESLLQALRMKHYEHLIISEKLYPNYHETFTKENREEIERMTIEDFKKMFSYKNEFNLLDVLNYIPYAIVGKYSINLEELNHEALIHEISEVLRYCYLFGSEFIGAEIFRLTDEKIEIINSKDYELISVDNSNVIKD